MLMINSAYFAYGTRQYAEYNCMQNMDLALLFFILFCIIWNLGKLQYQSLELRYWYISISKVTNFDIEDLKTDLDLGYDIDLGY